jgi:hypothetical protein
VSDIETQAPGDIAISPDERWSSGNPEGFPTTEEVVESLGLKLLGSVDAPEPLVMPPVLLARIRAADQTIAKLRGEIDLSIAIGLDLLEVDRTAFDVGLDIDTGAVTLTPRVEAAAS